MSSKIRGVIVAPITPFTKSYDLDEKGLRNLINHLVEGGVHGIMATGVTAESASLSLEEYKKVITVTVNEVNGRVPVIVTTGLCNTSDTKMMSKHAEDVGADALLVMSPCFWLPTEQGIYEHYEVLADAVDIPIFIFNNPHRTGQNLTPEFISRLANINGIVGIKNAVLDIGHFLEVIKLTGPKFLVFSGYDTTFLSVLVIGGVGVFSVVANVAPHMLIDMFNAFEKRDLNKAKELQLKILPIAKSLFKNYPASVKAALEMQGIPSGPVRKPLMRVNEEHKKELKEILDKLELHSGF